MSNNRIYRLLIVVSSIVATMLLVTAVAAFSSADANVLSSLNEPVSSQAADDPVPVLDIWPDPVAVSGYAGETAGATITVTEQGGLAAAQSIALQATDLSDGVGHVIGGTTMSFDPASFDLPAGEWQESTLSIPVPVDLPAGIYAGEIELNSLNAGPMTATLTVDTRPATITIDLQLDGAETTTFEFYGGLGEFSLSAGESIEFSVGAGSYTVYEVLQYGWELTAISCDAADAYTFLNYTSFSVASGETIHCTFVNQSYPLQKNVQLISQLGGQSYAAAVQGNYAYLGQGAQLSLLDIADPSNPSQVGQTGMLPEVVRDVAVDGDYAYVLDAAGLHIFDVGDPHHPTEIGTLRLPGNMVELVLNGDHLVVLAGSGGVRIVDIADPAAPKEVSSVMDDGRDEWNASELAVEDDLAYVIQSSGMGCMILTIFDISSPAKPEWIGNYVDFAADCFTDVFAAGDYVYLAVDGLPDTSWVMVDVSDPANPSQVGSLDTDNIVFSAIVVDEVAYLSTNDGLVIVDVSDPADLKVLGRYDFATSVRAEAVDDDLVFMIDLTGGLHIVDVSDPAEPFERSFTNLPLASAEQIAATSDDTLLLWNGPYGNFLQTVDISEPTAPGLTGWSAEETRLEDMVAAGDYAYVLADGLRIYNLENPAAPVAVGFLETDARCVTVTGEHAFLAGEGLRIIDVSDPSNPKETSHLDWPGDSYDVSAEGDFAYVTGETWVSGVSLERWLKVIDVSNADSPYEVSSMDLLERPQFVETSDAYVYILDDDQGLYVVDATNPSAPVQVGYYQLPDWPGQANDLLVSGHTVYVAYGYYGLRIIDASDPAAPFEAGYYNTPGRATDVALAGDYVGVADYAGGLFILRYLAAAEQNGITIAKETEPAETDGSFAFKGDLGRFSLSGGEKKVFSELMPGSYTVREADVTGWALEEIVCDSAKVTKDEHGVTIELGEGEHITCSFHNKQLTVTADAGGPYTGNEGTHITLDARGTANKDMVVTYKWDCMDDGIFEKSSSQPLDKSCKYADNGSYTVRLRTIDVFGRTSEDTAAVTVRNVPPQVIAGPDQEALTGQELSFSGSFTDPGTADTHTIEWDFGDGETALGSLTPKHTYATPGSYTVRLTVTDDEGDAGFAELIVTVRAAPPTLTDVVLSATEIDEGGRFTLSGKMSCAISESPLTLQIDWGDGHTATHHFAAGSTYFSITHTCADDNPSLTGADLYTIALTLSDESGASSTETAVIQVNNVAPTVNAGPDKVSFVDDNVEFSAAISDPGAYDTHSITWDFGDGSPMASGAEVNHKFATAGAFTVTVTATDDDGGVGQDSVRVVVKELRRIYFPLVIQD